ncbi:MAG TPA: HAD family hydrolase [Acidiferrobacteraceae bacterium]|nr:HAD family hydrolase [Acidiferrobacteraceae bacterium]
MSLAIFDLDNTLIRGDSDYQWGQFLIAKGVVDPGYAKREHDRYYADYLAGNLDIYAFLDFQLKPLAENDRSTLEVWRREFIDRHILELITAAAQQLVDDHRKKGDTLLIITATNSFLTRPIADAFGINHLIGTDPEEKQGQFTGKVVGIPSYREGKVERLNQWMAEHGENLTHSWFYSDSHNDLPLLDLVEHPVAVNPDGILAAHARERGWPIIDLD